MLATELFYSSMQGDYLAFCLATLVPRIVALLSRRADHNDVVGARVAVTSPVSEAAAIATA